jgi:hypothetical protein
MSFMIQDGKNERQCVSMHGKFYVLNQIKFVLHIKCKWKFVQFVTICHKLKCGHLTTYNESMKDMFDFI